MKQRQGIRYRPCSLGVGVLRLGIECHYADCQMHTDWLHTDGLVQAIHLALKKGGLEGGDLLVKTCMFGLAWSLEIDRYS